MKKIAWLLCLSLVQCIALAAATITVTSPAAHATWAVGQTQTIAWTATGSMDSRVKIILRSGSSVVMTIKGDTANDGAFSWTIPASITPGPDYVYYVRVKTLDNAVQGDSGDFAVMPALPTPPPPPPPSLAIISPNGGESWPRLSQQVIRWKAVNVPGKVKLELIRDNGPALGFIAVNLDPYSGSFPWAAGKYGFNQAAPAGDYRVIVRAQSDIQISGQSDEPFKITSLVQQIPHAPISLPKPDLVACTETAVYAPLKTLGWFHIYVRNVGQGSARAPFDVEVFMAGHTPQRFPIDHDLGPGETRWVTSIGDSKWGNTTIGMQVRADPDNVVAEADEGNNLACGVLYIAADNPQSSGPITCSDGSTVQGN
jgi:hypothetical protein